MLISCGSIERLTSLLSQMKTFEQRKYLNAIVVFVVKEYFSTEIISKDDAPIASSSTVSSAAALFHTLTNSNDVLKEHLVSSLTRSTIAALDESLLARRSVLAALAKDDGQCWSYTCWQPRLTVCREAAHSSREPCKVVWRFGLHQAYTCTSARRYFVFALCCHTSLTRSSSCPDSCIPRQRHIKSYRRSIHTSSLLGYCSWCCYLKNGGQN
jgi:hypothetical protein